MSGTAQNLECYLASLSQKAQELGATQAVAVPVVDIVVDERTLLKCLVPVCSHYGVDMMCPPNVLPVSKFSEMLRCYHGAVLIKVDIPTGDLADGKEKKQPKAMHIYRDTQMKLLEIVGRIESQCISDGYPFAAGLVGGSCPLCEECVGVKSGLPCRHPFKARPAMEALGIDVMATAGKAELDLNFSQDGSRSWMGLVLVD
ncbi:DUF2284 domain-containing protein [Chloroflexota bacterium]